MQELAVHQINTDSMGPRERAAFINSLTGPKSANLIGTYSPSLKHSNLAIVSSCFHLGADPALMGMIIRPHSAERHTLEYLLELEEYTINHVHSEFYRAAHQTSARYPREQSEFEATGLTPLWSPPLCAPYVKESLIRLGMKLREHQTLMLNQTELIIGEIVAVHAPFELITADGSLNIQRARSVCVTGLDRYHSLEQLDRLQYAKPELAPASLDEQYSAPLEWRGPPL
jgi:flavin reductase (DIM6/NTAB) family NADH-FMN oxidoreductase RutF